MSGHSKWATTKRQKSVIDAKRGKIFTKLAKALTLAARSGGADPAANPTLRLAIDRARAQNMPSDNIERAIKRGSGDLDGVTFEEFTYEAVGPGGSAFIIQTISDKKTRTVSDLKMILGRHDARLTATGSQAWQFSHVGQISMRATAQQVEQAQLDAIESGADDVIVDAADPTHLLVVCSASNLAQTRDQLRSHGYSPEDGELVYRVKRRVVLSGQDLIKAKAIYEALEENDDVQQIAVNF
ncbi:MAG: YebC/PmpR family DNA-binding transcriptional regulator [bacterium]|nr:YebC/PmpR family DNA-binding transcriptional regulator [bacterium]